VPAQIGQATPKYFFHPHIFMFKNFICTILTRNHIHLYNYIHFHPHLDLSQELGFVWFPDWFCTYFQVFSDMSHLVWFYAFNFFNNCIVSSDFGFPIAQSFIICALLITTSSIPVHWILPVTGNSTTTFLNSSCSPCHSLNFMNRCCLAYL